MSFCYNCGVPRSPVATVCEECGIRFEDREHLTPALPEWGSLILEPPPVRNTTDNRQAESTRSRPEKLLDRESNSAQPTAKEEIEKPTAVHQDVSCSSDQKPLPDYAHYYSGRMLDDVLSDFRSSDAELELQLDIPIKEQRKLDKKESKEMARARFEKRIRTIGNYGYARLGFINGALYSVRVLWRRFVLRLTLRRLKTTCAKAVAEAQRSLRDLGEVMYTMRDSEKMRPYREAVQAVLRADKEIDDTHAAQKQTLDSTYERMRKIINQNRERSDQAFEKNFEESGNARDRALSALARIGLANKPKGIAIKQITDCEAAIKKLKIANLKVEMYNRALGVYNPHIFQRGLYCLCSIAVLLIFLSVGVAFTVNGSTGKRIGVFLVDNLRALSQRAQGKSNLERPSISAPEPKPELRSNDTENETSIAVRGSDARDRSKKSGLEKMRDSLENLQAKVKQRNERLKKLEKGELY